MASRKITDLTEEMQTLYSKFNGEMRAARLPYTVTCTSRTYAEQKALFAQGRATLAMVNGLRSLAGLGPITEEANKKAVTWTTRSKHVIYRDEDKAGAFDIALLYPISDKKAHFDLKVDVNDDQIPDYKQAGKIGESVGLKWGGHFYDYCHFESPDP